MHSVFASRLSFVIGTLIELLEELCEFLQLGRVGGLGLPELGAVREDQPMTNARRDEMAIHVKDVGVRGIVEEGVICRFVLDAVPPIAKDVRDCSE